MKVTERERRYLILLGFLVVIGICYYAWRFVVNPLLANYRNTESMLAASRQSRQIVEDALAQYGQGDAAEKTLMEQAQADAAPFFPSLPQNRIMLMLGGLFVKSGIEVSDLTYGDVVLADPAAIPGDMQVPSYRLGDLAAEINGHKTADPTASTSAGGAGDTPDAAAPAVPGAANAAPASGNATDAAGNVVANPVLSDQATWVQPIDFAVSSEYAAFLSFIRQVEALNRTITVDRLQLEREPDDRVTGTLSMTLYAIDKIGQDPFLEWRQPEPPKTGSLFQSYGLNQSAETGESVESAGTVAEGAQVP